MLKLRFRIVDRPCAYNLEVADSRLQYFHNPLSLAAQRMLIAAADDFGRCAMSERVRIVSPASSVVVTRQALRACVLLGWFGKMQIPRQM
jgi:hypothetical protein